MCVRTRRHLQGDTWQCHERTLPFNGELGLLNTWDHVEVDLQELRNPVQSCLWVKVHLKISCHGIISHGHIAVCDNLSLLYELSLHCTIRGWSSESKKVRTLKDGNTHSGYGYSARGPQFHGYFFKHSAANIGNVRPFAWLEGDGGYFVDHSPYSQ